MNKDFTVPKIPIKLQIMRERHTDFQDCRLFLSSASRYDHGPETVLEFLNSGLDFVPVELNGKVDIINIGCIMAFLDDSESIGGRGKHIVLALKDGKVFTCQMGERLPESHSRIQDYLNLDTIFLEFIFENARLFVNKTMISTATDQ
ncbi:MAG: hypothetical protein GXO70_05645 [Acidobacteria bacterium]|nr:hypothetical protein [Acidobacteriota bacterium]